MSPRDEPFVTRRLSAAARGSAGIVAHVQRHGAFDPIAERLEALGFVAGEPVRVVATGPLGGEPLVVLVGSTRFALRRAEAERVHLHAGAGT